jgi:hypothetical protein
MDVLAVLEKMGVGFTVHLAWGGTITVLGRVTGRARGRFAGDAPEVAKVVLRRTALPGQDAERVLLVGMDSWEFVGISSPQTLRPKGFVRPIGK